MELKKLPHEVSKILRSSSQIHSYRKIVEELVFNALDSDASSVAVRIDFEEKRIQVVDNGSGISEVDMNYVGSKNYTSKCVDLVTLKSLPTKYGFRGESITNIINVAKSVKITSRYKNTNDTWQKIFITGKLEKIIKVASRPSQGTTVEIMGCFYNLPIQIKSCNPMQEIHDTKTFLEHMVIVHHSISVSFRNDAINEILLSIHKSRDIYQTIESVFNITKLDLQELHVEKNNYKVISYIQKSNQNENKHHLIYLNGRYLFNCKVHRIFDGYLIKYLALKNMNNNKSKYKNASYYYKDYDLETKQLPFYIVFLTCPYDAYDINQFYKQSVVEFRDWNVIDNLLEKLVKFYKGDMEIKEITKPVYNKTRTTDTRDRVKEIMNKLFENNAHFGISQLHKGVKGKLMKRQKKKRCIPVTKIINNKRHQYSNEVREQIGNIENDENNADKLTIHFDKTRKLSLYKKDQSPKVTLENSNIQRKLLTTRSKVDNLQKMFEKKSDSVIRRCNELSKETERLIKRGIIIPHLNDNNEITQIYKDPSHIRNFITPIGRKINIIPKHFSAESEMNKNKSDKINNDIITSYDLLQPIVNIKNNDMCYSKNDKIIKNKTNYVHNNVIAPKQNTKNEASFSILTFESHKNHHTVKKKNTIVSEIKKSKKLFDCNVADQDNFNRIQHKIHTTTNYEKIYKHKTRMYKYNKKNKMKTKQKIENHNYFKKTSRIFNSVDEESNFTIDFSTTNVSNTYKKLTTNNVSSRYKFKQFINDKHLKMNIKHLNNYRPTEKKCTLFNDNVINESENRDNKAEQENYFSETFTVFKCSQRNINNAIDYQVHDKNKVNDFDINSAMIAIQDVGHIASDELVLTTNNCDCSLISEINKDTGLLATNESKRNVKRMNIIFKSNSPNLSKRPYTPSTSPDPMNLCEVVMKSNDFYVDNDNNIFLSHDGSNNSNKVKSICNKTRKANNSNTLTRDSHDNSNINISSVSNDNKNLYKISNNNRMQLEDPNISINEILKSDDFNTESVYSIRNAIETNLMASESMKAIKRTIENQSQSDSEIIIENDFNKDNFHFVYRLGFIPKGMSPIFTNCNSKRMEIQLDRNNLDNSHYNEFIRNVETDCKIYETKIQNPYEFTTTEIDRAQRKLLKDNAAIIFDSVSLKLPKVLNQVDRKFIASKIMGRNVVDNKSDSIEYLVLFDQHAAHERIRLENNISEYIMSDCWKSEPIDDFVLKLSKEEMLYLYNFKEKLSKYGLDWSFLSASEISINAVPQAILGKITRPMDVIMKAVKILIANIVNETKTQKGSTSLYAPSIMELVFSEACRYAIKFGDNLSKMECFELIKALSECKMPFQCAHGRPVLAVLLELKQVDHSYKVNMQKVKEFKNRG